MEIEANKTIKLLKKSKMTAEGNTVSPNKNETRVICDTQTQIFDFRKTAGQVKLIFKGDYFHLRIFNLKVEVYFSQRILRGRYQKTFKNPMNMLYISIFIFAFRAIDTVKSAPKI
jgi:hypothetical protein